MPPSPDEPRTPCDAFLSAFRADIEADAVRPLAEYLARFTGDDSAIAREYRAAIRQTSPGAGMATGDAPGDRIAHYRLLGEIGRGGQGIVYLAEDMRLHRKVALKVLKGMATLSEDSLARFRREAEAASRLDHPGICAVYEAALDGHVPYIAMRLIEGEPLAAKIASAKSQGEASTDTSCVHLSEIEAARATTARPGTDPSPTPSGPTTRAEIMRVVHLIEKVARALHAAHEAGVIHRDMKPGNVMVTPEGEAVIMDFGLAHLEDDQLPTLTQTGEFFGTPAYMSPEQLLAQRVRLDRRTDVWSLGVMLYECVTLARPFDAPTREGMYQAIQTKEPVDPRRINRSVPEEISVVIETALEKDRDRRYQTALDLAEELRRVRCFEPIRAKAAGPILRFRRWAQRNPVIATAVAGLFAILTVGLAITLVLLGKSERERVAKENALADVTTERDAKKTALTEKDVALVQTTAERNEKQAALEDYERLGDLTRLEALTKAADFLWPAERSRIEAMKLWIKAANQLASRLATHEARLQPYRETQAIDLIVAAELRTDLHDKDPSSRRVDAKVVEDEIVRRLLTTPDSADEFKFATTARLVDGLRAFVNADSHKGLLADVRARLAFAESVERETIGKYESKWADAARSIADKGECPNYNGLEIKPQLGLIPLWKNQASGLWEFGHLQTTAPGTDPIPKRDPGGKLAVTESMGLVFVLIPGGNFRMGSARAEEDQAPGDANVDPEAKEDESPIAEIRLDPFFISKYEMTQAQWLRIVGRNPSGDGAGVAFGGKIVGLANPVEMVSWEDCDSWLGRLALVLPTEAQWEHAARGGTTTPRWCGTGKDGLGKSANVADQSFHAFGGPPGGAYEAWDDGYTVHAPVGLFAANPFGLHDVLGNVFEWCRDWYGGYEIPARPGDGLRTPPEFRFRVFRGGSYYNSAVTMRSAERHDDTPGFRGDFLGVRPARLLDR